MSGCSRNPTAGRLCQNVYRCPQETQCFPNLLQYTYCFFLIQEIFKYLIRNIMNTTGMLTDHYKLFYVTLSGADCPQRTFFSLPLYVNTFHDRFEVQSFVFDF